MAVFLLIRHGSHDLLGKALAGRIEGVALNAAGRSEAELLPGRLSRVQLAAVYSSPQPRARETAQPLARDRKLQLMIDPRLDEIDFGAWSGASFADLDHLDEWRQWNSSRSTARPPDGESMAEVQHRILYFLHELAPLHSGAAMALFSHGDVIKAALMGVLRLPLDEYHRFAISPASVSVVSLENGWERVLLLNSLSSVELPG